MPKQPSPPPKKRRTREHVIADLSANHVEKHALLRGFSVERIRHDYGIDLWIATYNQQGEVENGQIRVQLKATDDLKLVAGGKFISCRVVREDLSHWLLEPMPVILIVYDARADLAYWLYVQAYFAKRRDFQLHRIGADITVHIPRANVFNGDALDQLVGFRDKLLAQMTGVVHHD